MTSAISLDDLHKEDSRISPLFLRYKQIHEIIIISIYLLQASSQTYTIMTYGLLHPSLFLTFCLIYCLLLTLLQYFFEPWPFDSSTHGERVKDSVETFFHSCKPMEIAKQESGNCRMLLLGLMQVVSNLILLVAFFVAAGENGDATLLLSCPGDTTGMAVTNPSHSWRSLGWIVCFASCGRKSNQREQVDERKAEEKTSKMQKFLQLLRYKLLLLINRIGTKVVVLFACHGLPWPTTMKQLLCWIKTPCTNSSRIWETEKFQSRKWFRYIYTYIDI